MSSRPNLLLITTKADLSAQLFSGAFLLNYDCSDDELKNAFKYDFDFIYFRDPFNDRKLSLNTAEKVTSLVFGRYKDSYSVDGIKGWDDIVHAEDKWGQYENFTDLMPETKVLTSLENVDFKRQIAKKRISCRSRDIILSKNSFPANVKLSDYIVQEKLNIEKEYRVYMIGGEMIAPLEVKISKTVSQKTKVLGLESKPENDLSALCSEVYNLSHFDFIGLDVAKTKNGYKLLEVNRSCQFKSHFKFSGVNLAELLNSHLLRY